MEIGFRTKELRDLCEQDTVAVELLGASVAEALQKRLADLRAADAINEVVAGRPVKGTYGKLDCYCFELADDFVLTVVANHSLARMASSGQTDWARVRRIRVVELES